jgi:DNA-binding transcriptional LysR family regulator
MTRAASGLGIQQPPLSLQIRALEAALGTVLFRRHPKGVALTDSGRLLLGEAQRILADVSALGLMARVARARRHAVRRIHHSAAARVYARAAAGMPGALSGHRARALRAQCRRDHRGRRLAPAALQFPRVPVARPPGVLFETLLTEAVVVAVPIDHRLAPGPLLVARRWRSANWATRI